MQSVPSGIKLYFRCLCMNHLQVFNSGLICMSIKRDHFETKLSLAQIQCAGTTFNFIKTFDFRPNSGFRTQLLLFEDMHCGIDPNNENYRLYRLQRLSQSIQSGINVINSIVTNIVSGRALSWQLLYIVNICQKRFIVPQLLRQNINQGHS